MTPHLAIFVDAPPQATYAIKFEPKASSPDRLLSTSQNTSKLVAASPSEPAPKPKPTPPMFGDNGEDDIDGYSKNGGISLSDVQFVLLGAILGVTATMLYWQMHKLVLRCREGRDAKEAMISAASDIAGMPVDNECGMLSGRTEDPNQYLVAAQSQ